MQFLERQPARLVMPELGHEGSNLSFTPGEGAVLAVTMGNTPYLTVVTNKLVLLDVGDELAEKFGDPEQFDAALAEVLTPVTQPLGALMLKKGFDVSVQTEQADGAGRIFSGGTLIREFLPVLPARLAESTPDDGGLAPGEEAITLRGHRVPSHAPDPATMAKVAAEEASHRLSPADAAIVAR